MKKFLQKIFDYKVFIALLVVLLFITAPAFGQTTVFSEPFTGTVNTLTTSATSPTLTYTSNLGQTASTSGAAFMNGTQLQINNGNNATSTNNSAGYGYVRGASSSYSSPYNATLDNNTATVNWSCNMRTNRSTKLATGGLLLASSYVGAVVLACDNANPLTAGSKGYALVEFGGATLNKFSVVYFSDGINSATAGSVTTICSTADAGTTLTTFFSLKVTFEPSTKLWTLSFRDDTTAFALPLSTATSYNSTVSSGTNSTATNVSMPNFAFAWKFSTSTSNNMFFDNLTVVVNNPTITSATTALTGLSYGFGSGPSGEQSFTTSGQFLTANLTLTPPTNYEISTGTGGSFVATNPITLTPSSGTVATTTIYVRLKAALSAANYDLENITIASTGATSRTVACSGSVSSTPTISLSAASLTAFANTAAGANSTSSSFTASGSNLSEGITLTAPTNFQVSLDNSTFSSSVTLTQSGGTASSTLVYARYSPTGSGGYSGAITATSTGASSPTVAVSGYLSAFYYQTGSLATTSSWSGTANGLGTSVPVDFSTASVSYVILASTTTTAAWTVSGTGSKIIVGDPSVAAVTLTIANTLFISGTVDIPAALSGSNSLIILHTSAPTLGIMDANSEVHYQNNITTSTTKIFGKLFVDGSGTTATFDGTPVVQTSLFVAAGATMATIDTSTKFITINSGASVTINGTFKIQKSLGFVSSNVTTPSSVFRVIQFVGAENLTLGPLSTIEFSRGSTSVTAEQTVDARTDYVNLVISNSGVASNKSFAAGTLNVSGAFTFSNFLGILTQPSATTINYTGTSSQAMPSAITAYSSLGISGAATKTLAAAASVSGVLTVGTGATLATADFLTLKSDATGTARVAQVLGTITGNVTVERYIPAKRAWRALTAPVVGNTNNSVYANWQNGGTVISNTGLEIWSSASSNASVTNAGSGSSLLTYNSTDNNWTPVTNTSTASLFSTTVNNPFMAFVTGRYGSPNITSGATATTLKATGALLTGLQTYATAAGKYAFIGNPYASPLSLISMLADTDNVTNFSNGIWIWDSNGNASVGSYNFFDKFASAYSYTLLTTSISNPIVATAEIQSGQAFFVQSLLAGTFSIKEAHKGTTVNNVVLRTAAPELLRVGLYKEINSEWSGRDGAMAVILADAEANQTANKMANGTENVAFTKNGLLFASEHHQPLVATDVLNVKVWNTTAGANYKLKINTEQFTSSLSATLEDAFNNSRTPLTLDGSAVEYPFSVTTAAASTGNRFRIVFQTAALGINNPKANGFSIIPNPVTGDTFQVNLGILAMGTYSYTICNAIGQEVEKGSINNAAQNTNYEVKISNTAAGIYIMKIKGTDNTVFTAKLIKK